MCAIRSSIVIDGADEPRPRALGRSASRNDQPPGFPHLAQRALRRLFRNRRRYGSGWAAGQGAPPEDLLRHVALALLEHDQLRLRSRLRATATSGSEQDDRRVRTAIWAVQTRVAPICGRLRYLRRPPTGPKGPPSSRRITVVAAAAAAAVALCLTAAALADAGRSISPRSELILLGTKGRGLPTDVEAPVTF